MMSDNNEGESVRSLILENQRLLAENNELLKKLHRHTVWSFWLRVVWFMILIGIPFVLYYYVIEPYFTALGSSFETFRAGLQEVPGWKQFYNVVSGGVPDGE